MILKNYKLYIILLPILFLYLRSYGQDYLKSGLGTKLPATPSSTWINLSDSLRVRANPDDELGRGQFHIGYHKVLKDPFNAGLELTVVPFNSIHYTVAYLDPDFGYTGTGDVVAGIGINPRIYGSVDVLNLFQLRGGLGYFHNIFDKPDSRELFENLTNAKYFPEIVEAHYQIQKTFKENYWTYHIGVMKKIWRIEVALHWKKSFESLYEPLQYEGESFQFFTHYEDYTISLSYTFPLDKKDDQEVSK